jgi:hypothetical protein
MALARGFFEIECNDVDDDDLHATTIGFAQHLPNMKHEDTSVVVDAYFRTRRNRTERERIKSIFLERFKDADSAASITYLDGRIPVHYKRSFGFDDRLKKIAVFTKAIEKHSGGKLRLVDASGLVYTDSLNCSVVVFEKVFTPTVE